MQKLGYLFFSIIAYHKIINPSPLYRAYAADLIECNPSSLNVLIDWGYVKADCGSELNVEASSFTFEKVVYLITLIFVGCLNALLNT